MNKRQEQEEEREPFHAVREMGSFSESGAHDTHSMAQLFGSIKNPFT